MEEVANARKDGKCWRYKRDWQRLDYRGPALDNAFAGQVIRFSDDIRACPELKGRIQIRHADARKYAAHKRARNLYDGVLTSPPYLNSFDYTDIYRPELLLLNKARNSADLRQLRFSTMRSHVQVAWKPSPRLPIPMLVEKIDEIDAAKLWDDRIPEMVNAYFVDLDRVVGRCARCLKAGAPMGVVVADSAYGGVVVPVHLILAEIFERRGFSTNGVTHFRHTLGNGHHQQRSNERLEEVMVLATYRG